MIDLYFYTTLGCHLCEQAEQLLMPELDKTQFSLKIIDIAEQNDDVLLEKYGLRIPVLKRQDNQQELSWSFEKIDLKKFLE